jgi:predicted amidohydrolase
MLKIGIAQTSNHFDYEANFSSIETQLRALAKQGADLALLPECATTGYNSRMLKVDEEKLRAVTEKVRTLASELSLSVVLPTPFLAEGKIFNSVLVVSDRGEILHRFDKRGLQKGEEKMFAAGELQSRSFDFRGYRLGVLICVETTHGPWEYVKPEDGLDAILWPGFYAPREDGSVSAADESVSGNLREWGVPLILANTADSPEREYWPGRKFGASGVRAVGGEEIFKAKRDEADSFVVILGKDRSVSVLGGEAMH